MKDPRRAPRVGQGGRFELVAVLLVVAAMGAASMARRGSRGDQGVRIRTAGNGSAGTDWPTPSACAEPAPSVVLQPITREVLVQRSLDIFPAGYLANISIIQGVALSVLVSQALPSLLSNSATSLSRVAVLVEAAFVFVAIVVVSYEYLWFTTILRWVPTFRDTVVPLILGVGEIVPALLLERRLLWWIVIAVFIVLGALAYLNTLSRLHIDIFGGESAVRKLVSRLLWRLIACCAGGIAISGATATLIWRWPTHNEWLTIAGGSLLVLSIAVGMVAMSESVLNKVYEFYGIRRRPMLPH